MKAKVLALSFMAVSALVSCSVINDDGFPEQNDSVVTANYLVSGSVKDEDGTPVPGIMVVADHSSEKAGYRPDTLYTDKGGKYSKFFSAPLVERFSLRFSDIDGDANGGEFEAMTEYVVPLLTEVSSGYFGGSFLVTADVELRRK